MTCLGSCEGCPLAKVHYSELSELGILRQTGIAGLEGYMTRMEAVEEINVARVEARDYYSRISDPEALEKEDAEDAARDGQRRKSVSSFWEQEFDRLDQREKEKRQELSQLQSGCPGPLLRRKYIAFGSKVLKCRSGQVPWWQRLLAGVNQSV